MLLGQGGDVVLEGVGHPAVANPHVADTLKSIPEIVSLANSLVDQLVEVEVVAEDDMATHVEQEALWGEVRACQATCLISLQ